MPDLVPWVDYELLGLQCEQPIPNQMVLEYWQRECDRQKIFDCFPVIKKPIQKKDQRAQTQTAWYP
jgi:hypothetical protein